MTEQVEVQGHTEENAVRLLAAAEDLGLDRKVVRTTSDGFVVPKDVHDKAFDTGRKSARANKKNSTANASTNTDSTGNSDEQGDSRG